MISINDLWVNLSRSHKFANLKFIKSIMFKKAQVTMHRKTVQGKNSKEMP